MKSWQNYLQYLFAMSLFGAMSSLIAQIKGEIISPFHIIVIVLGCTFGFFAQKLFNKWSQWKQRDQNDYDYLHQGARERDRNQFLKERDTLLFISAVLLVAITAVIMI